MKRFFLLIFLSCFAALNAVQGGFGLYLLGFLSSKSCYLPPPGVYFRNDIYHHPGHIKGGFFGNSVQAKAHAKISLDLLTFTLVTPYTILGAKYACGVIVPVGRIPVHASANIDSPRLMLQQDGKCLPSPTINIESKSVSKRQTAHGLADTLLIPFMLGWDIDAYDLHALFYQGVFVPTGGYSKKILQTWDKTILH